jgi:hypothetical protein
MPNNRIENLRIVTQRENTHNAHSGKWQARIWIDGKLRFIGYFSTPEEAEKAYQVKLAGLDCVKE